MGPTPRGDGQRPQPWPLHKTRQLPTSFATPSSHSVRACAQRLVDAGLDMLSWPPTLQEDPEPNQPKAGWQQKATRKLGTGRPTESSAAFSARACGISTLTALPTLRVSQDGINTLEVTRPPASLQMRPAALSNANPCAPTLQPSHTLLGGGQIDRSGGHTGIRVRANGSDAGGPL